MQEAGLLSPLLAVLTFGEGAVKGSQAEDGDGKSLRGLFIHQAMRNTQKRH